MAIFDLNLRRYEDILSPFLSAARKANLRRAKSAESPEPPQHVNTIGSCPNQPTGVRRVWLNQGLFREHWL
jgi:hypothetical protein